MAPAREQRHPPCLCKCYVDLTGAESVHIKTEGEDQFSDQFGVGRVVGRFSWPPAAAKKSPDWNGVELILNLILVATPKKNAHPDSAVSKAH